MAKTSVIWNMSPVFIVLLLVLSKVAANPLPNPVQYVAVIDAGSTASRIIVYGFERNETNNELQLHNSSLYREKKPGLSAFVDNIEAGVQTIAKLIKKARKHIESRGSVASTPLVLIATAGLRMANKAKADLLLKAIDDRLFKSTDFKRVENAVQIMDGSDEGIFSWITVNYLKHNKQIAAMDLGGGSTQITLPIANAEEASQYKENLHRLNFSGTDIDLFTHSYLGSGFQAARYAILTNGNTTVGTTLESVCINPQVLNASWSFNNVKYEVKGKQHGQEPGVNITVCADLVRKHVISKISPKPITLKQHQLAAWNGFFSATFDLGTQGEFVVGDLRKRAEQECALPGNEIKNNFHCLDLIYTSMLLTEGFELPEDFRLLYVKEINGVRVSWTLGCALNLLNTV